jgi:DNA topoisomerase-1
MAKKSKTRTGKALVIVESPAKAKTIGKYLGRDFIVEASIGHVRDLPKGKKEVPKKYKDEPWADLAVNTTDNFTPIYITSSGSSRQIKKLKDLLKNASGLYLATDEDREGEAISWHLLEVLKPKVPVYRLVFHEITKEAIQNSLSNSRDIDEKLVQAQETRRILDRLYGYGVSPLLWRRVRTKLSAGRVQSVAIRLIVERERERMAFVRATYWDLLAGFSKPSGEQFETKLVSVEGKRIPVGKDFDPATGKLKHDRALFNEEQINKLLERIRSGEFHVATLEEKPFTSKPYAPFTTSTLQQEANRKLGFTARRTMQVAQALYENGHITYMRTDSTNLASVAVDAARDLVDSEYGKDYLHPEPRNYQSNVANAQEAHEAIRPAGHPFELPSALENKLRDDEYKLFQMIWKRTIASQMSDARGRRMSITVEGEGCVFQVGGKVIDFPGHLRAYVEGSDDPDAELADKETLLPDVAVGDQLDCQTLETKSHTTAPPSRYSEAALTAALEEKGIGRPSTYASIIDTILNRGYVFKRGNALVPTWVAFSVVKLLESHLPSLVDYAFTKQMEDDLDAISRGEADRTEYLHKFWFGNGTPGLETRLENLLDEIDAREIGTIPIGAPENGELINVRVGRYTPYLEQGERKATLPEETPPDEVTVTMAMELLDNAAKAEEPLGRCPDTNKQVFLRVGRFGPYIQRGTNDDDEKPQNAGLLKGMETEDIDLATALKLLSLPRELGTDPVTEKLVVAYNGRYGPYVKSGDETRSLPNDLSPLELNLEQALTLLAQPKKSRKFGAKKEPLKTFEESPVTGEKIQLLDGRYGPYVTDGETNASLSKDTSVEDLTVKQAINLLAERAAKGPTKKKKKVASTKKGATKKKGGSTKKGAAKKKGGSTKKGAAKKKGGRKKKESQ